jgi:hypothetical protein
MKRPEARAPEARAFGRALVDAARATGIDAQEFGLSSTLLGTRRNVAFSVTHLAPVPPALAVRNTSVARSAVRASIAHAQTIAGVEREPRRAVRGLLPDGVFAAVAIASRRSSPPESRDTWSHAMTPRALIPFAALGAALFTEPALAQTSSAQASANGDALDIRPVVGFAALSRPTGIAEAGFGWLTLPGAEVCQTGCSTGDTSFELEAWQLFRASKRFAFGAGSCWR